MATAFETSAIALAESDGTPDDLVITKPTGLASGDLMIAILGTVHASANYSLTDWTTAETNNNTNLSLRVLWKIADAGDVAASNFTFTITGQSSGDGMVGVIARMSGASFTNAGNLIVSLDHQTAATSHSFENGIVPPDNSILLMGAVNRDDAGSHSAHAIANNNPTWAAQEGDQSATFARDIGMSLVSATPSSATDTGNSSITFANTEEAIGFLISVVEDQNATGTFTHLEASPTINKPSGSAGVVGTFTHLEASPTINKPSGTVRNNIWTAKTKGNDIWTNTSRP